MHRWLGIASLLFILLLASTGIALNHSDDWNLDQRFVNSTWVLNVYGVSAPTPSASFADDGHRATLLGKRLYFDGEEIAHDVDALTGLVALDQLVLVTSNNTGLLVTRAGQYVETIELVPSSETIIQVGRVGNRPFVQSSQHHYVGDTDVTGFEVAQESSLDAIAWSQASPTPASDLKKLERLYRGRGVTIERVISDLHSGRIVGASGTLLMDVVAVFLIVLSLTGLAVWLMPKSRRNQ